MQNLETSKNLKHIPYFTPIRMTAIKKPENNKSWQGYGETGTIVHCCWECKMVQFLWKTMWWFLRKLKLELPYDSAILLLGIYTRELKTEAQRYLCTHVHSSTIHNSQKVEETQVFISG